MSMCEKENIPLVVLILFVFEGNNIPDGLQMGDYVNQYLGFGMSCARERVSLSHSLIHLLLSLLSVFFSLSLFPSLVLTVLSSNILTDTNATFS
jgi:hypothetical protein